MRRWVFEQSLTLFFVALFFLALLGQSVAGFRAYNEEQEAHNEATVEYGRYLVSSDFAGNVMENWQSEFLAVATMAAFSIFLRQRGSAESKPVGAPHEETGTSS